MSDARFDEWGNAKPASDEAEDSYFVSMTDIMVGLLFIFIIMLMAFGLMLKVAAERTEQTREEVREAVRESAEKVSDMRRIDERRAAMLRDIEVRLKRQGINVTIREENGVLQLPDEILFDSAKSELKPNGKEAIGNLAQVLDVVLPCYTLGAQQRAGDDCPLGSGGGLLLESVFVEGHTDSDGSQDYNWRLSTARAINTFRELSAQSNTATTLRNSQDQYLFSVAGYGENRPISEQLDEEGKRQNRRIDLRFVMNISHAEALEAVQMKLQSILDKE